MKTVETRDFKINFTVEAKTGSGWEDFETAELERYILTSICNILYYSYEKLKAAGFDGTARLYHDDWKLLGKAIDD